MVHRDQQTMLFRPTVAAHPVKGRLAFGQERLPGGVRTIIQTRTNPR
jgi:hypothetical protein